MDLSLDASHVAFRESVQDFLRQAWPPPGATADTASEEQLAAFRTEAVRRGYVYRYIPSRYGGGEQPFDALKDDIVQHEFRAAGAPLGIHGTGPDMIVPTLLKHGTDELREEFIAKTLSGEITWCQGYSEPGAGSDLASLTSRAALEGDEWVIHGHKVWTSDAERADWMFGLFRTEEGEARSRGISYLLLPMHQDGVEVRPLVQMTGDTEFSEVFFDAARTHVRYTIGGRGKGWQISQTTLGHERALIANPRKIQGQFADLVDLARASRRGDGFAIDDPGVRRRLVEIEGSLQSQLYTHYRQLSDAQHGREPAVSLPALVSKLHTNEIGKEIVKLAMDLVDADESLCVPDVSKAVLGSGNEPGGWMMKYLFSHGSALGGGAPNIQRNIIGERGLGLPRDLRGRP